MLKKTINEVLEKKFNHWVDSIKDESLAKKVKEGTIITGGAIVSLMQNEEPNDYDLYFKTKELTIEVATYYCNEFNKRTKSSFNASVETEEDRVKIFIKSVGVGEEEEKEEKAPFASYNEALDETDNVVSPPEKSKDKKDKVKKGDLYHPRFLTSNAITLSEEVQLITRFYGEPEEIHKNYDFVHTRGYWTSWEKEVQISSEIYEAVMNKRLLYIGSLYPICSMFRIRKFLHRGWNISAGEILKIAYQINQLDLTNIDTLEDQLFGVDSLYFADLISYLRKEAEKQEDFKITEPYLISLIDKVFN